MSNNELFAEFPPISKADWIRQITKDLKDKSLEDLEWQIADDLRISPFVHAEDFETPPQPLWVNAKGWEICAVIPVENSAQANAQAMEALNGGAEGLEFVFRSPPNWSELAQTLAGIHLNFIGLHFSGSGVSQNPAAVLGLLLRFAKAGNVDTLTFRGSVAHDPVQAGGPIIDWRYLVELLEFTAETFPLFKVVTVDFSTNKNPSLALAETLKTANEYLKKLTERGVSVLHAASCLQFSVPIGKSYFLEMAKIRALKLLWLNVLKPWGAPLTYPNVSAHFQAEAYGDDLYTNMIRATTMSLSAVMGGADRLSVLPYDSGRESLAQYPAGFGQRIARNVQHLMKMESQLETVSDPAAGSYYIEKLTATLAEKAWVAFAAQD